MTNRIYQLADGRHVDLASIVEIQDVERDFRDEFSWRFFVRYVPVDTQAPFGFEIRKILQAVEKPEFEDLRPGIRSGMDTPEFHTAVETFVRRVRNDLLRAWTVHKNSAADHLANPVYRFGDGTHLDLSEILDLTAPAVVGEDVVGFGVLYKGQAAHRNFRFPYFAEATGELFGPDFEEALASPHGDPDRVALSELERHVDGLVEAWRAFKRAA